MNSGRSPSVQTENVSEQDSGETLGNENERDETSVTTHHRKESGNEVEEQSEDRASELTPQRIISHGEAGQPTRRPSRNNARPNVPPKKRQRAGPSTESPSRKPRPAATPSEVTFQHKDIISFFKESTPTLQNFHQPTEIYDVFCDRCPNDDPGAMWLLTRLYFAIGSPTALQKLRATCVVLRQHQDLPSLQPTANLQQILHALDRLDVHFSVASVLRRFYLVSLKSHRLNLEQQDRESASSRTRNATKRLRAEEEGTQLESTSTYSRADSRALATIMEEAYPGLQTAHPGHTAKPNEYQKRLSALKDRLRSARNWGTMQADFTPAILLLIPTGKEYQIRDSE